MAMRIKVTEREIIFTLLDMRPFSVARLAPRPRPIIRVYPATPANLKRLQQWIAPLRQPDLCLVPERRRLVEGRNLFSPEYTIYR